MKPIYLAILTLTECVTSALSQGTITFGNQIPGVLQAPIYGWEFAPNGDYANAKTGNTATGLPAGTQNYNGVPLAGWNVQFFVASPGTDPTKATNFFPVGPITLTGTGSDAGFFPTTTVQSPFLPSYGQATVQVRVWRPIDGASNWSDAWLSGGPWAAGASALFTVDIGGTATGFRSFSTGWLDPLTGAPPVPEPGVLGFSVLGLVLLARRLRYGKGRLD